MDGKAEGLTASVLFGTAISACGVAITAPLVTIGGLVLGAAGGYMLIKEIIEEPQRRKFEACGLTKDNAYPKAIENGKDYIVYSIPTGLSFNSFYSKKDELEVLMNSQLEITKRGNSCVKVKKISKEEPESKWNKVFEACELVKNNQLPKLVKEAEGDTYHFSIPPGMSENDFYTKQDEIETALKRRIKMDLDKNYNMNVTLFRDTLKKLYKFERDVMSKQIMKFATGVAHTTKGEECQYIDLNTSDCHMGIFGTTGSGKSAYLKMLITQAVLQGIELKIIDLKGGVETKMFSRCANCTDYTIFPDEAEVILIKLHAIMHERYAELNRADCKDYKDYNKKYKGAMKPIILIIEEYSLLFDNKEVTAGLFLLLNLARAANISVILTLQRPDHKTLDTRVKSNLRTIVCFKYKQDVDSEIVLGRGNYMASKGLKNTPNGRGILNTDMHDDLEFQAYFLDDKEIMELIKDRFTKQATLSTLQNVIDLEEKRNKKEDTTKTTVTDIQKIDLL